jgi:hypothetical protein
MSQANFRAAYEAACRSFNNMPPPRNPYDSMTNDEIESLHREMMSYMVQHYDMVEKYTDFLARVRSMGY